MMFRTDKLVPKHNIFKDGWSIYLFILYHLKFKVFLINLLYYLLLRRSQTKQFILGIFMHYPYLLAIFCSNDMFFWEGWREM
jgi:hypothetical protein